MATFSQFKSKYITESGSKKNVGQRGTKNIVKKSFGKDAIPDDGGKRGQARIEKELGLNKPNKTVKKDKLIQDINKRKSADLTRADAINRSMGTSGSTEGAAGANTGTKPKFSSGATGTSPSGSPEMGGESKKFVQNRRKKLQTKNLKPEPKNVVKPDKFTDVVKKFQGSNKNINNIKKIPASEVKPVVPKKDPSFKISGTTSKTTPPSKPTFTKTDNPTFKDFKKRGISFDIKKSPTTVVNPVNLSKGPSLPNFVGKTSKGNIVTQSTSYALPSGGKTTGPSLPNFVKNKSKSNPITKVITRGMETTGLIDKKVDTNPFTRTTDTITRNVGKVKPSKLGRFVRGAGRIIAPIYAIKDYVDTTKKTRAQGFSKNYSRAKGLTRALSGYIGGGIGATFVGGVASVPGAISGGVTGYNVGQRIGDKAFDYGQKVVSGKKTFKDIRKDINSNVGKLFKPSAQR